MPLNYNTNTFVDAKQSLINALQDPNSGVNESNVNQYLKSINIDPVEFDRELKEENQHTIKFNELLKVGRDGDPATGGLSRAEAYHFAPGYLKNKYATFTDTTGDTIIGFGRSAVEGAVQLGDMLIPETAQDFIKYGAKKIDKLISDTPYVGEAYEKIQDVVVDPIYKRVQEVVDPVTSETQELIGDIGSLLTGTRALTKTITNVAPKIPGFAKRIAAFTGAEVLLGDKEYNMAQQLVEMAPETFEPLKVLAIKPDDPDSIKIIKKAVDATLGGGAFESVFGGIKGINFVAKSLLSSTKKNKFIKETKGKPPANPKVSSTEIVDEGDDIVFKSIVNQPVKILSDPNVGKRGNFINRWITSRQGMDKWTYRVYENKEANLKAATDLASTYSREFERAVKKVFKTKYDNLPPETIALIRQALGSRLPMEKNATAEILKILEKSGSKRTKKEIDILTKHLDNNIQLAKNNQTKAFNMLPKDIKQPILKLRTAADDVSREIETLGLGNKINATIDKNIGIYLTEDFEAFVNPTYVNKVSKILAGKGDKSGEAFEIVNAARVALQKAMPKASKAEIDGQLKNYIDKLKTSDIDFLDATKLGGSNAGSSSSGNILKNKKLINDAYKILLNPIKDPLRQWNESMKKMSDIVVEHNFLSNIKKIAQDEYGAKLYKISKKPTTTKTEDFSSELENLARGYISQLGPKVNPLANVFTSPEYKKVLQRGIDLPNVSDNKILGTWYGISGYASAAKTSLSSGTHIRNMESNLMVLSANGNLGLGFFKEAPSAVLKLTKNSPAAIAEIQDLASRGVLKSGVRAQQIIKSMNDAFKNSQGWMKKAYDKSMGVAGDVYSAEDDVFKIIGFHRELARYKKAYPNMNENELRTFVAEIVKDTMPTYNFIPRSVKYLRRLPIGTFPAFTSEIIRNTYNISRRGALDVWYSLPLYGRKGNAGLLRAGAGRLAGLTATGVATQQYLQFKAQRYNISATDQEILEDSSASWGQNEIREYTDFIEVNPKTGDIEVKYRNLSYSIPQAPIIQVVDKLIPWMMSSAEGYKDDYEFEKDLDKVLGSILKTAEPMINESLLVKPLLDLIVRNGKTRQGKSIWNETDDNLTKAKKSMFHIGKALAPGDVTKGITFAEAIKSDRLNEAGGITKSRFPKRLDDEIKSLTGFKNTTMNLNKNFSIKVGKDISEIKNANKSIDSILRQGNIDWNNPQEKNKVMKDIERIIQVSYSKQVKLAKYLNNFKKLQYFEGTGKNRTKVKMSVIKMLEILKGKGLRNVDDFYYTLLEEPEGGNRIGSFVPPAISSSALVLQNEYNVPNNISLEIQSMLQQLNGLPLIIKESEQEETAPIVEDTSNIDRQQGD
jgi:hypothetical protein